MVLKVGVKAALAAALGVALAVPVAVTAAHANDISTVEGARAKQRQGRHLNGVERDALRRYGGNDDDDGWYGRRYRYGYDGYGRGYSAYRYGYSGYGYGYGGYGGPGVTIYIGPGRYYGPYGY